MSRLLFVIRAEGRGKCVWQDDKGHYRACDEEKSKTEEDFKRHEADPSTIVVKMPVLVFRGIEAVHRAAYGWPEPVVKEGPIFSRAMCLHTLGSGKARVYWKDAKGHYREAVCSARDAKNFHSLQDRFREIESRTFKQSPDTYPAVLPVSVLASIQQLELAAMGLKRTYEALSSRRLRLRRDDRRRGLN